MLKILFFTFALLFAYDASAVRQSVSKALSYRNISGGRTLPNATTVSKPYRGDLNPKKIEDPVIVPPKDEQIDLSSSDTGTVSLKKNDTVEITLQEEDGYRWKFSPSASSVSLQSNKISGNQRLVKYKMLKNINAYIYFDYIKTADNSIVKSKQLTIKLRD